MIDEGQTDWKIIAIDNTDPMARKLSDISDIDVYMPGLIKTTLDWFRLYKVRSYALSFYRSQNVLGWSKFFVPDQKFIYILWQSQTFCARQKDDLHSVKLVFVPAQKVLNALPFTGPKMFCAGPNFLSHPENLIAYSASSKTFVPAQNKIY